VIGLLAHHDVLLLDLDGVVYVGPHPVAHAVDALRAAHDAGARIAYVTNNAARPPEVVAEHLRSFGLPAVSEEVVTSAQAAAREVLARVGAGARVLAVGGLGVAEALRARGLEPVDSAAEAPTAVVMGYGPEVGWAQLAEAAYAVGAGALLVATNLDTSIPTPRGIAPGNGTLVAAVAAATGHQPDLVAGKPWPPLVRASIERTGAQRPLMVGDRLDTDIEAGHRTGVDTLLVLTGVTDVDTLLAAPEDRRPTYVGVDLRALALEPDALRPGTDRDAGDGLAPLRAACTRAWSGEAVDPSERAALAALVEAALRA
jgi:HAD superfamily hydrolase (TIGR01450 family)